MPRALVVTLSSGEAEEAESAVSVAKQTGVTIDHRVIRDLPELDAHNALLELFRSGVGTYDIYVKVDADTIIDHDDAFLKVHDKLTSTNACAVQLYLHDYFTDNVIFGLNFFSPTLNEFVPANDPLYCDRSIIHKASHLYSADFVGTGIEVVGRHCAYPHDRQAFHFGYHRAMKNRTREQSLTIIAAKKYKDRARIMACMGFDAAKTSSSKIHNYSHEQFIAQYEAAARSFETYSDRLLYTTTKT